MTFSLWIIEVEWKWPHVHVRRLRHRHKRHRRHEITFTEVHEDHTIHITTAKEGHRHGAV